MASAASLSAMKSRCIAKRC